MEAENAMTIITARRLNLYHREAMGNIASAETSPAQSAHQAGEYLTFNGVLYRVEADIEQGGTLVPGTNIVKTTVDEMAGESHGGSADIGLSVVNGKICITYDDGEEE